MPPVDGHSRLSREKVVPLTPNARNSLFSAWRLTDRLASSSFVIYLRFLFVKMYRMKGRRYVKYCDIDGCNGQKSNLQKIAFFGIPAPKPKEASDVRLLEQT